MRYVEPAVLVWKNTERDLAQLITELEGPYLGIRPSTTLKVVGPPGSDLGPRVLKAFAHAVQPCGGEAAILPPQQEPF